MSWDAELLRRFREGEPEALAQVFREHAEGLTRMLRVMSHRRSGSGPLNTQVEIENLVLETFARAFEPRARTVYDGVRPYAQFLMGIARNVVLEQLRSRELSAGLTSDPALADASPLGAETDWTEPAIQQFEDRELEAILRGFVETLSPEDQRLYAARVEEPRAQETVATELGLTRIQLRRRELALKQRLVEYLQSRGYLGDVEVQQWKFVRRGGA